MRTSRPLPLLRLFLASLLFVGLGAFATVRAQDTDGGAPSDEPVAEEQGTGFFAVGTQFTDLAPLNDRLSGTGYPTFASEMVSLGGGPDASLQGPFLRLTIGGISGPDDE